MSLMPNYPNLRNHLPAVNAAVDEEANNDLPAISHARRSFAQVDRDTNRSNPHRYRMANLHGYEFSVSSKNRSFPDRYLGIVPDKLVDFANSLGTSVDPRDLQWLRTHKGRFQLFVEPRSTKGNKIIQSGRKCGLLDTAIKARQEFRYHQVLGSSPRWLALTSKKPSYVLQLDASLRSFWNFLAMTGNYESMLMLLPHAPSVCPSIDPNHLHLYVMHLFANAMSTLHARVLIENNPDPSQLVKDIYGSVILCQGTVDSGLSFKNFFSAIHMLHKIRSEEKNFRFRCLECYEIYRSNANVLTDHCHKCSQCNYCNQGNPIGHIIVLECKRLIIKDSKARGHAQRHADALLPDDVRRIGEMDSFDNLCHLQKYTMILGAIYYAGRFDGYCDVQHSDFNNLHLLFRSNEYQIKNLAQQVKEKCDDDWVKYLLYFDDHHPNRCYLRHLLVFVHCTNTTVGHVFTTDDALHSLDTSVPNQFTEAMDYHSFSYWLTNTVVPRLRPRKIPINITPHSFRGTFYLLFQLGNGDFDTARLNARHACTNEAFKYWRDSATIFDMIATDPVLLEHQAVAPARSRIVLGNGATVAYLAETGGGTNVSSLAEAAKFFVENMLDVSTDSSRYRSPGHLLRLAMQRNFSQTNIPDQLLSQLTDTLSSLPIERRNTALQLVAQMMASQSNAQTEHVQRKRRNTSGNTMDDVAPSLIELGIVTLPDGPVPEVGNIHVGTDSVLPQVLNDSNSSMKLKWKLCSKRSGKNYVLPNTTFVKGTSTRKKIEDLRNLVHEIILVNPNRDNTASSLHQFKHSRAACISGGRSTFSRWLTSFAECLLVCHNDSSESFFSSNPEYRNNKEYKLNCTNCCPPAMEE